MNNKGQALVEFVLILPVFVFILFIIIVFGMIINSKNSLENKSVDIIEMVKNNESIDDIKMLYSDIDIEVKEDNKYLRVTLTEDVKLITPGLNRILSNPYETKVERIIYND